MQERVERFELIAWQKARVLTSEVYKATADGEFGRDFGLKNQIQRAAVSVMSNLAEGFERGRPAEFHQFLSVAKGLALNSDHNFMWRSMLDTWIRINSIG